MFIERCCCLVTSSRHLCVCRRELFVRGFSFEIKSSVLGWRSLVVQVHHQICLSSVQLVVQVSWLAFTVTVDNSSSSFRSSYLNILQVQFECCGHFFTFGRCQFESNSFNLVQFWIKYFQSQIKLLIAVEFQFKDHICFHYIATFDCIVLLL